MKYILIENLVEIMGEDRFLQWEEMARNHLNEIENMSSADRAKYFKRNSAWNDLYAHLSELSGHKCWYSEAPENSSEWSVDHFRPKNESKNENNEIILEEGYWWLAYYWKNYRLSGSLVNLCRKDRFHDDDEVYGKGAFFPLDLTKGATAQPYDMDCECEIPLLLDPINPFDVTLVSFDKDGGVYETYNEDDDLWKHTRAKLSIKYYGLDHEPIKRGRRKVWHNCEIIIEDTRNKLQLANINHYDITIKEKCVADCYKKLVNLSCYKKPYSMVVYSIIKEKIKDPLYEPWLKDVLTVLQ